MKRYTIFSFAAICSIILAVAVVYSYNYLHRRELRQSQQEKMFARMQTINDASDTFRERIVVRSQQLEKSGLKGSQLEEALSSEERQAKIEMNHQLHLPEHS
jgi:hypothetical protein